MRGIRASYRPYTVTETQYHLGEALRFLHGAIDHLRVLTEGYAVESNAHYATADIDHPQEEYPQEAERQLALEGMDDLRSAQGTLEDLKRQLTT